MNVPQATLRARRLFPIPTSITVIDEPRYAPSTNGNVAFKGKRPDAASATPMAIMAVLLWSIAVRIKAAPPIRIGWLEKKSKSPRADGSDISGCTPSLMRNMPVSTSAMPPRGLLHL
jgi:hypothetical protein